MNWKLFAIIAATAVATAAAVVFLLQRQNDKHRMRFDSAEFDDDDFDIGRGEQCNYLDDDLDIDLPDDIDEGEAEAPAEEAAKEAAEDAETEE